MEYTLARILVSREPNKQQSQNDQNVTGYITLHYITLHYGRTDGRTDIRMDGWTVGAPTIFQNLTDSPHNRCVV